MTKLKNFDSRLESLKLAYQKRIEHEIDQITLDIQTLIVRPDCTDTINKLHQSMHKLSGSAGTFGYEQLGLQARTLEQLIANSLSSNESLEKLELTNWLELLNNAKHSYSNRKPFLSVQSNSYKENTTQLQLWLIERDKLLADFISEQLRSFGFKVKHFVDGELLALQTSSPDLLIVDHDARSSSDQATSSENYWKDRLSNFVCPIIFTGAEESFAARLKSVRCGGRGYFIKPLDVPQLAANVANLLKGINEEPERVLIVEDDTELAQHCKIVLEHAGMQVKWLNHPRDIIKTASDFNPELVIMDLWLPEANGAEVAALLTQMERWAQLPIIYLSVEHSVELRTKSLSMGGDAFFEKPIDPDLLVSICRSRVKRLRDLEKAINRDSLTGLIKHAAFKEALQAEWIYVRRHPRVFSVVMVDIDHFKSVNDIYGHAVGDLVIAAVGTLLRQRFRHTDKLARYGGEEFALVLPDCSADKAEEQLNQFREAFQAIKFIGNGKTFNCTLSAGVVDNQQFPDDIAESLLERADKALYKAKRRGRNKVCQFAD